MVRLARAQLRADACIVLACAGDEAWIIVEVGRDYHVCPKRILRGQGVMWQSIATRQLVYSAEYAADPAALPELVAAGVRQMVCTPIIRGSLVVGVLLVTMVHARRVSTQRLQVLGASAQHLSLAYRHAELRRRHTRELDLLAAIAADISADVDRQQLLQHVVRAVTLLIEKGEAYLWLYEAQSATFVIVTQDGRENTMLGTRVGRDEGAIGAAIQRRAPVVINDYQDWSARVSHFTGSQPSALLAVPLFAGNDLLGAITVVALAAGSQFLEHDVELVQRFAQQATIAIKNERLYRTATRRADLSERLRLATRAAASSLDMAVTIERIFEQMAVVLQYESGSIQLVDVERAQLTVIGGRGFLPEADVIGRRFALDDHNSGAVVVETRAPLIVDPARSHWGFSIEPFGPITSWLGVPMIVRDTVIGIITLDRYQGNAFSDDDAQIARSFADHVAVALDHAELYAQLAENARIDKELYDATLAIGAVLDSAQLYERIYHATARLLNSEVFVLALVDADEIDYVFLVDDSVRHPPVRRPLDTGLAGYVIRTGESIHLDRMDDEIVQRYNIYTFGQPKPASLATIAVPLRVGDRVIGMLSAQTTLLLYTSAQQRALEQLAASAAIAIENARLFGEVQRLATIDQLTGLYNRNSFFRLAEHELERARRYQHPLAVLLIDADRFKLVNDTYGHRAGDLALRTIADRCRAGLRTSDIFGRYGGEEMVVLLPETDLATATRVAERLRELVDHEVITDSAAFGVTCSFGVAEYRTAERLDHLLERADRALYRAKHAGRNRVMVYTS